MSLYKKKNFIIKNIHYDLDYEKIEKIEEIKNIEKIEDKNMDIKSISLFS
jgi:hypothetical protein